MLKKSYARLLLGGMGFLLAGGLGCQTWVGGMTLPSPDYLKDKPDYIAPAPQYKHARELAAMQRALAETNPSGDMYPSRAPVAPAPAPAAPPAPMNPMAPMPMGPGGQ
jgi:hypothetical protein